MTLTIELTPEQEAALRSEATARRTDEVGAVRQWLNGLQATTAPVRARRAQRARELFSQWDSEDEAMTDEESEQAERDWQQFQAAMNTNRAAQGERLIF